MHHQRLKSALDKFQSLVKDGKSEIEIMDIILKDKGGYTDEEAKTIYAKLSEAPQQATDANEAVTQEKVAQKEAKPVATQKTEGGYEEWKVDWPESLQAARTYDNCEKLKLKRKGVKISDQTAEIMNARCNPLNPTAYFKA